MISGRVCLCGDEAYFDALQIRLDAVAKEFGTLPADVRASVRARLGRIHVRAHDVGWASVMLLTNYCTRSTLARPESGPARWIDDDRDGGTVQVVARPPGAIRCKAPRQ